MAVAACARKEETAGGAKVAPAGDSMAMRAAWPDQIGGCCVWSGSLSNVDDWQLKGRNRNTGGETRGSGKGARTTQS